MNAATIARITKACRLGNEYDVDRYLMSDIERRARAYAAYATLRDEMPGMLVLGTSSKPGEDPTMTAMFEAVYSGEFARSLGIDYRGPFDATPGEMAASILASQGKTENPCVRSREAVLETFNRLGGLDFESDSYEVHSTFLGHLMHHDAHLRAARAE